MMGDSVGTRRAADSDCRLDGHQIESFDDHGFLVLRDRIPSGLLARLQGAADDWIDAGKRDRRDGGADRDYRFAEREGRNVMFRVDYLHAKGQAASLELLGSPAILGIASGLAGRNFVPTYESMVFKDTGDGAPIRWHQDAVHPRRYRIFNVDIYLDAAEPGQGPLRVLPGSHHDKVDICALEGHYGWEVPGSVEVEMEAGDVLVHDVMLVHGSEPTTGFGRRRTIYYEFRPAEQILSEGPWDRAWVDQRLSLLPPALGAYRRANPDAPGFAWDIADDLRPGSGSDGQLRVPHVVHTPGSYCSAGDVPIRPVRPS